MADWLGANAWARWAAGGLAVGAIAAALHYDGRDWIQALVTAGTGAVFGLLAMAAWHWVAGARRVR